MSRFTTSQRQAIEAPGNVLVVAGAGTGKTRTLVQRCLEWLLAAPGERSIDQVLMVTFTEAAAAEMRQRIRAELVRELGRRPNQPYLQEQLALLETACIGTLHSFCFRLIRQHFYQLDLDPQLAVLPAEEAHLLAHETLETILEEHYSDKTPVAQAVQSLIHRHARGWDVPVRRLILRVHRYAQSLPDAGEWLAEQLRLFAGPEPAAWREWLQEGFSEWQSEWLPILRGLPGNNPNVAACVHALAELPTEPVWKQCLASLDQIGAADAQSWPYGSIGKVRARISDFFEEADYLRGLFGRFPLPESLRGADISSRSSSPPQVDDPLLQDWEWVRGHMTTLLGLVSDFGKRFGAVKRERAVVDFQDLEQFSLRLLWDNRARAVTAIAESWRRKLRLILVDEYQDINAAQDALLCALAGEGTQANRFLVGDPKQSIYRFRLANPHIFQHYTRAWRAPGGPGQVIALTENFRSHETILKFVNQVFEAAMRAEVGGIEYDDLARLVFGDAAARQHLSHAAGADRLDRPLNVITPIEVHLRIRSARGALEEESGEQEQTARSLAELSQAEAEARLIGLRLADLRAKSVLIRDERGGHRPVEWQDMVILLRSPQRKVEAFAKEFSRLGIPLVATRSGLFECPAVGDLLALLSILDNPLQDIPLLTVLRSPIVGLSLNQLALIRLAGKGQFWGALRAFGKLTRAFPDPHSTGSVTEENKLISALGETSLRELASITLPAVTGFLDRMTRWRRSVRQRSIAQSLEAMLQETDYLALLLGRPRGLQERANVAKLLNWARQFDEFQQQGLYSFLRFIEAQREADLDHEPAPLDTLQAVRLMSIHQSKGLEFPVVVVADLGKAFNLTDLKADVILDERYGVCPMVKPPFTQQRYPSLPNWLARRRQRRETFGEELRLLYVAMTRACQSLILSGSTTASRAEAWLPLADQERLSPRQLLSARTYLDWLGPAILKATGAPTWADLGKTGRDDLLQCHVYAQDPPEPNQSPPEGIVQPVNSKPNVEVPVSTVLREKLAWSYPFAPACQRAAKMTVSSWRAAVQASRPDEIGSRPVRVPTRLRGAAGKTLSASEVGTAHHRFLQFVSLDAVSAVAALDREADRLQAEGVLSAAERAVLDLDSIAEFWSSAVGLELQRHQDSLRRELGFTLRLAASEASDLRAEEIDQLRDGPVASLAVVGPGQPERKDGDYVIVTGVVDLVALLPAEIWFLDFKTDDVEARDWEARAREYGPQMRLYALALSRVYGRPVTRAFLHSLGCGQTLDMASGVPGSGRPQEALRANSD